MDFFQIRTRAGKRKDDVEIYPEFMVNSSKDLMIRGRDFYAVWCPEKGLWSTDQIDVRHMVDKEIDEKKEELEKSLDLETASIKPKYMKNYSSRSWSEFEKFCKSLPNNFKPLDDKVTFANTEVTKEDYISKRLPYNLEDGDYSAWDELVSTLYSPEEREKLEWAIGSIVAGDSKKIQKFIVMYGAPRTGKSTVLEIIQKLFNGYTQTFEAEALTSIGNSFSMEAFASNPLVAIQADSNLSKIETNTRLNSIVSHDMVRINEKFKASYDFRINSFLFLGTNNPVKITDAKSGIIRRLIDIEPTGKRIAPRRYDMLMSKIEFELGAIAKHCLDVYKELGKNYYQDYRPMKMIFKTDPFFNFVEDSMLVFSNQDGTSLKSAYAMYKNYIEESGSESYRLPMYKFREELRNYFREFSETARIDGKQVRSYFSGFKKEMFEQKKPEQKEPVINWLTLDKEESLLDIFLADCLAQLANEMGVPPRKWENCKTCLKDINTKELHYVKPPENLSLIVIDFDLKDENGEKNAERNLEAAAKWPPTYAEFSKGGSGIHLHYIYEGDPTELAFQYSKDIEVKVFTGGSSLRRKLSFCNDIPIAKISGGLPLKEKKMVNFEAIKNEQMLRALIKKNLNKEILPSTRQSIDLIFNDLKESYESGMKYDVTDLRPKILAFANNSTHQSDYCIRTVSKMIFKSDEPSESVQDYSDDKLVFFDVEVFPNLFLVNWKYDGVDMPCVRMINPTPQDIEGLLKMRLVGFNCRRYDNHMLYARLIGKSNLELFDLSQRIINNSRNAMFGEAYNLSYTDVYDFSSKKQSLKKWEIELDIHHQELGLPWDQPVPEEMWPKVAEYCDNDVIATEAVFHARSADWTARKILANLAGLTVNDTTNTLTTRIIFGTNRKPQSQFNYRDLSGPMRDYETYRVVEGTDPNYTVFDGNKPIFPGYSFDSGKSIYRGEEVGEGGYVYAEPGMYWNVALLDIASMHPSSIVAESLFGDVYTKRFKDILDARIAIKHRDFDKARTMLDGKLAEYLDDESQADDLAAALKIAINSVYGLTSAKFDNPFHDIRNKDNIVAKRGALFMVNLKHEVQARGFTVAHIKTDSIKIPNATPEIIKFVMDYGKEYGYNFELESVYDRMCLVNDAVYIAHVESGKHAGEWVATGAQFQQNYVYKTLFTKEPIQFKDLCETKSVSTALYLDMNENLPAGEHKYIFVGKAGSYCPIIKGGGGGLLMREKDGKYDSATGAKGYRWLESEVVKTLNLQHLIDHGYFKKQAQEALEAIAKHGDAEAFRNLNKDEPLPDSPNSSDWRPPCGSSLYSFCYDCPHYFPESGNKICEAGYDLSAIIKEN